MNERDTGDYGQRLFDEGASLFSKGNAEAAVPLLEKASEAGNAEAQNLLGIQFLNGIGASQDIHRAASLIFAASQGGLREAHYNISNILFNGLGLPRDAVRGQEHLRRAARAGHRPALRTLGFFYHFMGQEGDWPRISTECFRIAAQAGDPYAQYIFGLRLLKGDGAARDIAAAASWLASSAKSGVYLASTRLNALPSGLALSKQVGPPEQTPVQDMDFPPCVLPDCTPVPASRTVGFLSEYPDALDPYLCDHLINVAAPQLMPSGVVNPKTGEALRSQLRTSYSMFYKPSMYDAVVARAMEQIAAIAGLPAENAEPMGLLRYGPGQEYRPHFDYYSDSLHEAQRIATVFVYLNDVLEGGGTDFPRLGVQVQPERGKAVKFFNCDAAGHPNPETLHAGLPVIHGEKWLSTLWFWDKPFFWFAR